MDVMKNNNTVDKKKSFSKNLNLQINTCYSITSKIAMKAMHSIPGHIIILTATFLAIFNIDIKILCFDVSTDTGFSLLNEIIFFILTLEFILLVLFKKDYIGSFFFYMDFLAVLALIPDTDFIMEALISHDNSGHHSPGLDSTHHMMKASAASQAGARASRYIKIVRFFSFIKIIRLSKVLATAKELNKPQIDIDFESMSLSNLIMSKRRGFQEFLQKQQKKKKSTRNTWSKNGHATKILINMNKSNLNSEKRTEIKETEYKKLNIARKKFSIFHFTPITVKDSMQNPNLEMPDEVIKLNENSNFSDKIPKFFIFNNCNINLSNISNNFYSCNENQENLDSVKNIENLEKKQNYFNAINNDDIITPIEEFVVEIDELDTEDLNFINRDTKSENGGQFFKNPLKIELDKFLDLNAIDLEELLYDKNIVLICEKEANINKKARRSTLCRGIHHFLNKIENAKEQLNTENGIKESLNEESKSSSSYDEENKMEDKENSFSPSSVSSCIEMSISSKNNKINKSNDGWEFTKKIHKTQDLSNKKNNILANNTGSNRVPFPDTTYSKKFEHYKKSLINFNPNTNLNSNPQPPLKICDISNRSSNLCDESDEKLYLHKFINNSKEFKQNEINISVISNVKPVIPELKHLKKFEKSPEIKKRKNGSESWNGTEIKNSSKSSLSKENTNINNEHKKASPQPLETVEEKLTSKLANKLVIVIMTILVVLPILEEEYVESIRYGDEGNPTVFRYCLETIDQTFIKAIADVRYIKTLDIIYRNCLDLSDDGSSISKMKSPKNLQIFKNSENSNSTGNMEIPMFYRLNFTLYTPYKDLLKIFENENYENLKYRIYLPKITYEHPNFKQVLNTGRENVDYITKYFYTDDSDSSIIIVSNNQTESRLSAYLNIIKIIFIAFILLSGVSMFSNDIQSNVTKHLEKIQLRVKYYLTNTDSLTENIEEDSNNSNDLRSAYEKALLLFDEKENEKNKKSKINKNNKKNDNETYVIDENLKIIINLMSISLGKQILSLISKSQLDAGNISLNLKHAGIKTNAAFLMLRIDNLDALIKKYKTNSNIILSKIYTVFHSQGITHQGDICTSKNIIVWKEDRENFVTRFKLYVYKLCKIKILNYIFMLVQDINRNKTKSKIKDKDIQGSNNRQQEENKNKTSKDEFLNFKFEFSKDNIHNMSFICANKVLYQLYFSLPKMMKILQEMNVRINLILNYGELINGYIGHEKVDENFTGLDLIESERILKVLNKRHRLPGIYLHHNFYENLSYQLEELVFPCEFAKIYTTNSDICKMCYIYKINVNFQYLNHRDQDMPLTTNKKEILLERKIKLLSLARMKGIVDDFVVNDKIIETYFKLNLKNELRKNIVTFFDCIYKNKLDECVVIYRRIDKDYAYEKFKDQDFKISFKNLYVKILGMISKGKESKNLNTEDENYSCIVNVS